MARTHLAITVELVHGMHTGTWARHGVRYVSEQQARAELTRVNREIRRLRTELAELEERRAMLGSDLGE